MIPVDPLPGGALRHALPLALPALPPVTPGALEGAWDAARAAADAGLWGPPRLIACPGADPIALTDPDAACWAEAMSRHVGLDTLPGWALTLRLLALVEAMGRHAWLRGLFTIGPGGAEFHPALLAAAAQAPLDATGRFAEGALRGMLARSLPP